jgi:hypothetical protein
MIVMRHQIQLNGWQTLKWLHCCNRDTWLRYGRQTPPTNAEVEAHNAKQAALRARVAKVCHLSYYYLQSFIHSFIHSFDIIIKCCYLIVGRS